MSDLAERLIAKDSTLWPAGNVSANRLGWIDAPSRMLDNATSIIKFADMITQNKKVVLLGLGGSSLGPEVLRAAIDSDRMIVLDTTDPETVAAIEPENSFFLVSSKSGSTLEVSALLNYFWSVHPKGDSYAAITDAGSPLEALAKERNFLRCFINPPDIGGRFSVLSYFGLVPAALLGYNIEALLKDTRDVDMDEAVELGVQMAEAYNDGRDKVTVVVPPGKFSKFGLWIEQLVGESLSKQGKSLIPVPTTEPETGSDRFIDRVQFQVPTDLGIEFFRWQVAVSIAAHLLEVDPFDEPNVVEAKANTQRMLSTLPLTLPAAEPATGSVAWLKGQVKPGDYVSIQAYLPYKYEYELELLRRRLRDELGGLAVTAGFGPRFLHSTGQMHKGGANNVVALQLVSPSPTADVAVPGTTYDFATLISAQSIGDYESLKAHGRRVRRVAVTTPDEVR